MISSRAFVPPCPQDCALRVFSRTWPIARDRGTLEDRLITVIIPEPAAIVNDTLTFAMKTIDPSDEITPDKPAITRGLAP
ncbi:hypothetical protein DLM86_08460 [Paenibacillus flagellatus]|uniref:Uncharacterized protein n=1 Tax=Paenibacillus flagellatus TaxID=2211139 RepID=A0A2V5KA19_9BACL|nr:hypothetical protein DLM86_08460 [Paenibacillus flagellatus]